MKKNSKLLILFNITFPLILGGVLYYILCPQVTFVKIIDSFLGFGFHYSIDNFSSPLITYLRFYIFDLIWGYTLSEVLYLFVLKAEHAKVLSILGTTLFGALMEIVQIMSSSLGTFDYYDILAECIGSIAGTYIIERIIRRTNYEE